MEAKEIENLIAKAYEAKKNSYAPYSNFHVGAALLTGNNTVYAGCNIENAAYSPTNCAERTAIFKAVSEGEHNFSAIAIVGDNEEYLAPCGVCRQVMMEFCDPFTFLVILAKNRKEFKYFRLGELLPESFSPKNLEKK